MIGSAAEIWNESWGRAYICRWLCCAIDKDRRGLLETKFHYRVIVAQPDVPATTLAGLRVIEPDGGVLMLA